MYQHLSLFLQDVIYVIIVFVLPTIVRHVVSALKAFVEKQSSDIKNEKVSDSIIKAEEIVENIVLSLNQTIVDTAKKNETWNEETATEVKNAAVETAYDLISDTTKQIICDTYNSFGKWLDIQIEKTVNENK